MRPSQKCVDIPVGFEWLLGLLSLWAGAHTLLIWASTYSVSALLIALFLKKKKSLGTSCLNCAPLEN